MFTITGKDGTSILAETTKGKYGVGLPTQTHVTNVSPKIDLPSGRGKFIFRPQDGLCLLPRREMEDYLLKHGRNGQNLGLAFLMTADKEYLREALRDAQDPSAAVVLAALKCPEMIGPAELAKFRSILGPDDVLPDKLALYMKARRGEAISLHDVVSIDWKRACSDPTAELVASSLKLTMELGDFTAGEALQETMGRHAGTGFNGPYSGGDLSTTLLDNAQASIVAGNKEEALKWVQAGAVMAENNRAGWSKSTLDASLLSEKHLVEFAQKHGIEEAWTLSTEIVLQQIESERRSLAQLDYFKAYVLPHIANADLLIYSETLGLNGEVEFLRALANDDKYKSIYERAVSDQTKSETRRLAARGRER